MSKLDELAGLIKIEKEYQERREENEAVRQAERESVIAAWAAEIQSWRVRYEAVRLLADAKLEEANQKLQDMIVRLREESAGVTYADKNVTAYIKPGETPLIDYYASTMDGRKAYLIKLRDSHHISPSYKSENRYGAEYVDHEVIQPAIQEAIKQIDNSPVSYPMLFINNNANSTFGYRWARVVIARVPDSNLYGIGQGWSEYRRCMIEQGWEYGDRITDAQLVEKTAGDIRKMEGMAHYPMFDEPRYKITLQYLTSDIQVEESEPVAFDPKNKPSFTRDDIKYKKVEQELKDITVRVDKLDDEVLARILAWVWAGKRWQSPDTISFEPTLGSTPVATPKPDHLKEWWRRFSDKDGPAIILWTFIIGSLILAAYCKSR